MMENLKNLKSKKVIIVMLLFFIAITAGIIFQTRSQAMDYQSVPGSSVDKNRVKVDLLTAENTEMNKMKDQLKFSSNPLDVSKDVEQNLSVLLSLPADSNPSEGHYYENREEYQKILKMGPDAMNYLLSCFKDNKCKGLRGELMMKLCKDLLGDRNNVKEGEYKTPEEWYAKLVPYVAAKLEAFEYTGNDLIEQLVYTAALEKYKGFDPHGSENLSVVAPHIFGAFEKDNEIRIFATVYYSNYTLYDKVLTDGSAGLVPTAIIYSKSSDGTYTLKKYTEAQDGEGFGKSIEAFCAPRNDIAKKMMGVYGNDKQIFNTMTNNLKSYLKIHNLTGISLKDHGGTLTPLS